MTQPAEQHDPQIQRLGLQDYEAICAVWAASGLHIRPTGRDSRENFARQLESGIQIPLGATLDGQAGQLVGVALVTHDGRKGWINRLAVRPEVQRRGVGRALIRAGEQVILGMGLEICAALIEHFNAASLALFQSEGYKVEQTYYVTKRSRPDA